MPTVIIPPTDVSPNTGTGSEVLSNAPTLVNPIITGTITASGNITAADLILGSSGPSVKSTLSARAPRQGLVFDGTAGATVSVPAFGTSDFSCAFVASVNNFTNYNALVGSTTNSGNFFFGTRSVVGDLGVILTATGSWITSGFTPTLGKVYSLVYTRSGTTGKFYVDGVLVSTVTEATVTNYSTALNQFGSNAGTANAWPGIIEQGLIYNRALSASEVVSLYEAGAPAGADYYNTGAGAASVANVSSGDVSTVFTGVSANGFTATRTGGAGRAYVNLAGKFGYLRRGTKMSIKATLTVTGTWYISQDAFATSTQLTTGSFNLTMTGVAANDYVFIYTDDANATLVWASNDSKALGTLLAPDAAQAGGGLVWYDTSGNAANISWTSGVSWNVPTSGNLAGNLQVNGTGNNVFRGPIRWGNTAYPGYNGYITETNTSSQLIPAITRNLIGTTGNTQYTIANAELGAYAAFELGTDIRWFAGSGTFTTGQTITPTELMRLTQVNGNLLIGTTSDVGDKLQVNGSISASPSGAGYLVFTRHGSQNTGLYYNGAQGLVLYTNTTTALTLDSSQNAKFAGNLTVGSATTPKGKIDAQGAYDGSAPSTSSTPIIRANNGGAISLWVGGNAYSNMWMQAIQDDGSNNIKNINFQPLGGDVYFGGNATFAGATVVSGTGTSDLLSYNILLGGTKRLILGYDTTNDYGLIASIDTGVAWKNLVVNPIGGSLLIGMTAPVGSEKLQTGGSVIFNGYAGIADGMAAPSATTGYAKIYVDSADGDLKVIFGDGTVKTIVTD